MSRSFTNNIANYLSVAGLTLTAQQSWSLAAYVKPTTYSGNDYALSLADDSVEGLPRLGMGISDTQPSDTGILFSNIHSTFNVEYGSNNPGTGSWVLIVGTINWATDDITLYVGSSTGDTNNVAKGTAGTTLSRLMVGGMGDSSPGDPFDGLIAQVAVWEGLVLSSANVQSLLDATTTSEFGAVQSGSLLCHYPLDGTNLSDATANLADLSVTGTVPDSTDEPLTGGGGGSDDYLVIKPLLTNLMGGVG